jgi:hypothetical protein
MWNRLKFLLFVLLVVTVNLKVPGYSPFEPRNFAG